jgi:hypothetical protein
VSVRNCLATAGRVQSADGVAGAGTYPTISPNTLANRVARLDYCLSTSLVRNFGETNAGLTGFLLRVAVGRSMAGRVAPQLNPLLFSEAPAVYPTPGDIMGLGETNLSSGMSRRLGGELAAWAAPVLAIGVSLQYGIILGSAGVAVNECSGQM